MKLSLRGKVISTLLGTSAVAVPVAAVYTAFLFLQIGGELREGLQDVLKYGVLLIVVIVPILVLVHIWLLIRFLRPTTQYLESPEKTREMAFDALAASYRFPLMGSCPSFVAWTFGVVIVFFALSLFISIPWGEYIKIWLGVLGAAIIVTLFQYYLFRIVLNPETEQILKDHPDLWKERDKWGFRLNIRRVLLLSFVSLVVVALMLVVVIDYSQARSALLQEIAQLKFKDLQRSSLELASILKDKSKPDLVNEYLSNIDVGPSGYAFLLNEDGEVVSGSLKEELNPQITQRILGSEENSRANYPLIVIVPYPGVKEYFLASDSKSVRMVASSRLNEHGLVLAAVYSWKDYKSSISGMRGISIIFILIAIVICTGIVYLVAHNVSGPMVSTLSFIKDISDGDLTEDIAVIPVHEVGDLIVGLKHMKENLRRMIGRVEVAEGNVELASERLSENSEALHSGAQSQSSSVEGVSTFMDNVDSSLKTIAENTSTLSNSATESSSSIFEMGATIEEVAGNVEVLSSSVEEVFTSIDQMSTSVKQVAEHAENLRRVAEETVSAMREMDVSIKDVESIVQESSQVSERVREDAQKGVQSVDFTLEGMSKIRSQVREAHQVIDALGGRAKEIGKILNVIDEVAGETNLLSLNAAIIAAQAGEQGRAFAVVADEVSGLADRTASSTKEISSLIQAVQDEVRRAVEAMALGSQSVEEGFNISSKAQEALRKIGESVGRSTEMMVGIARSAGEQAKRSKQVSEAMNRLADMVAEIAKATQEQARGTELIMGASEKMRDVTLQVKKTTREQYDGSKFITQSIENIMEMVKQIDKATGEQSRGIGEVIQAVGVIKKVTQENLEGTSEMTESVEVLKLQARSLKEEVDKFRL